MALVVFCAVGGDDFDRDRDAAVFSKKEMVMMRIG